MNNCERLVARRNEEGLSQVALAKMLGMSANTIHQLEHDETRWRGMYTKTVDKINGFLDGTFNKEVESEPIEKPKKNVNRKPKHEQTIVVIHDTKKDETVLNENDKKTLTLIEFAYEGLSDSKTHDDFVANINMLKRILKKYNF